ncbi:hypothetical protein GPX89_05780 [Nocardia sp. ET3-3]|uniref:SHOCT domain-containing protein n=1 Tax=Nocardia terrae TaxID=2675851 RepID=A0A7K1UQY5_9NOCA|nr:hypothetical protein [Nocardia terrae]MVU76756.1 hypothetical protein [Nocardia terrae]
MTAPICNFEQPAGEPPPPPEVQQALAEKLGCTLEGQGVGDTGLPHVSDPSPGIPVGGQIFLAVVVLVMVAIVSFGIYTAVRRYRAARELGIDPLTADLQWQARIANSATFDPAPSTERRLDELEHLYRAGKITHEEHQQARARLLGI